MQLNLKHYASALLCAALLSACGNQKTEPAPVEEQAVASNEVEKTSIKIGTTVGDFGDMVKESIKPILEKQGYSVELIEFTDYVRPNLALAQGDIDVNVFQHKPYLDDFKQQHKLDLTEMFQVPTAPLGIYPGKLAQLSDIKDEMSVSAPNDPSNFARALVMMNELGWITLKDGINPLTASTQDIADNPHRIQIKELEAAQLPRSRADVDFAIVTGNYAISSGMSLKEALYQEPSYAYVNWGAVRTADKDTKWVSDVIAAYASEEFKQYCYNKFIGYKYPEAWGAQPEMGQNPGEVKKTQ